MDGILEGHFDVRRTCYDDAVGEVRETYTVFGLSAGDPACSGNPVSAQTPNRPVSGTTASAPRGAAEGFVDSGGVKIHYVSLGKKEDPLLVMVHGFPDFWYSWRAQMPALAKTFTSSPSISGAIT